MMHCPSILRTVLTAATLAVLATGCATVEKAPAAVTVPPTDPRIGPVVQLLGAEVVPDVVRVIGDPDGSVHVFVVSRRLRQVLQVSVSPDGYVKHALVRSEVAPWKVDAAFDSQGQLHLLLDADHLVLQNSEWRASNRMPWHAAGVKVESARFVAGAPELTWTFQVDGGEFGASRRMEIYGIGGGPAGLIWPWFTHGSRAVFVAELSSGFGPWVVLEPQGVLSTFPVGLAADKDANLYTVYERSSGGIAGDISYRYARIDAAVLRGAAGHFNGVVDTHLGDRQIRAVEGSAEKAGYQRWGDGRRVAVDPESGTLLIGTNFRVQGETWTGPMHWPLAKTIRIDLVPAGNGAFHALAVGYPHDPWWGKENPIYYLHLSDGAWSNPVELGQAAINSFLGQTWYAVCIADAADNSALLVWPTANGLVGRWVRGPR